MKRFVSYLYSIYNNQKIHNAGFARMELRTGRNRVDIHLKENGYAGKTGTVYLFIRKRENIQGISIGTIIFRNNQAEFRYEQAEENIGQTPWKIMQMNGILILIEGKAAFLSQWDEQPVDTARFEVWEPEEKQEAQADARVEHEKSQQEDNQTAQNETLENSVFANQSKIVENNAHPGKNRILEDHAQTDQNGIKENGVQIEQNKTVAQKTAAEQSEQQALSEMGEVQTENTGSHVMNKQNENEQEELDSLEESQESTGSEQVSDIQTAELQPQVQNQWSQNWRYMLRTYPVLNQFQEEAHVLCVRIEIKDVRLLPEKYWSIINNSFLLHGFFNYRHLAFGKIEQSWFIGVPGVYQNQEHVMASIFGFPDFLPQKQKNEQGEQPGYWYRILESV